MFDSIVKTRNVSYIMNAYSRYYLRGEEYNNDINFIQINLNYNISEEYLMEDYMLRDKNGKSFIYNYIIYNLNMEKYMEFWYNKDKEEINKNKCIIMLDLSKDDLEILSKNDKVVLNYMNKVNTVNNDPKFQSYMSAEEDNRKLMNSYIHKYYDEGIEKGKEISQKKTIHLLYDKGLSIPEISKYLKIDENIVKESIKD